MSGSSPFSPINRLLACALLVLPMVGRAVDTAYAPPIGGMSLVVPAGQTRTFSLPLVHDSIATGAVTGRITAVGTNYLENSSAGWTPGELSSASNPYYLRIKTGAAAGRVLMVSTTANTTTRVNLTNDGTDLTQAGIVTGANGDVYELVLADTLFSLFGSSSLQGGTDWLTADNVNVWGGAAWIVFYYNTTRNRWERNTDTAASPSRNTFVLRPDRGIMVTRRAAAQLNFRITGRVPVVAPRHFNSRPGTSFLSNGIPVDITLGNLALQSIAPGWVSGSDPATSVTNADLLQVWGGAAWIVFFYNSERGRWERNTDTAATPSRDTFVIPAGRPLLIRRLTSGANSFQSVVPLPLPYTVSQ